MPQQKKTRKNKPMRSAPRLAPAFRSQITILPKAHMCLKTFVTALADPFQPDIANKVCFPSFPSKPSGKFICTFSHTTTIGADGTGYVMMDPSPFSDAANQIWVGSGAYTQAVTPTLCVAGAGVQSYAMAGSSPLANYTKADANEQLARLVVAGIRIRYIGREDARGGRVVPIINAQNASYIGALWSGQQSYEFEKLNWSPTEWAELCISPRDTSETAFVDNTNRFPFGSRSTTAAPFMGFTYTGTAGEAIEIEAIVHMESAGHGVSTESDIAPTELVHTALAAASNAQHPRGGKTRGRPGYFARFLTELGDLAMTPEARVILTGIATAIGGPGFGATVGTGLVSLSKLQRKR